MKKTMIIVAATLLATTAMALCGQTGTYSSETVVVSDYPAPLNYREVKKGDKVERDMKVGKFASVSLSGAVTAEYVQSSQCRLVLRGEAKDMDRYQAEVKNGTLHVKTKKGNKGVFNREPKVKAYIYAPSLESIMLSGAGDLEMREAVKQDGNMNIMVSGAGDIDINDLQVESLSLSLSGAGDVDIDRAIVTKDVQLNLSGAGDVEGNIKARDIKATVSGAGDVDITVDCRRFEGSVSGTGDMKVKGKCQSVRTISSGLGSMNTKQLKVTGE